MKPSSTNHRSHRRIDKRIDEWVWATIGASSLPIHSTMPSADGTQTDGLAPIDRQTDSGYVRRLLLQTFPSLFFYGCVMGSRGMWESGSYAGNQWMQIIFSGIKVPLLLAGTFMLSLPSFFVMYALAGLSADFRRVVVLLLETQALFGFALVALSPFTLFWYGSTTSYVNAVLFNALLFGVATVLRQIALRAKYRDLIARNTRHRILLRLWFFLYAFVGIQTGWLLRPFIGTPGGELSFLRPDSWGNAYIEVVEIIGASLRGGG